MKSRILCLSAHEATMITDKDLTSLLRGRASSAVRDEDEAWTGYWVDLLDADTGEWDDLLKKLEIPENDRELCLETLNFPQAEALTDGGLFLNLPCRNAWQDAAATYLNVVLINHVLITQHAGELAPLDKVRRNLQEGDRPDIENSAGLLLYILQGLMESGVGDMLKVRAKIEAVEDVMETQPETMDGNELRRMKHSVEHLTSQTEEQLFCLTLLRALLPSSSSLFPMHTGVGELMDALNHLERSLQRLETRMGGFLGQLDSRLRDRTDQRLRILTIISAVFMPLTFIAGIYGMNFENLPPLKAPWGYGAVTVLMLGVGVGMLLFFWKRGWFK